MSLFVQGGYGRRHVVLKSIKPDHDRLLFDLYDDKFIDMAEMSILNR